MKNNWYVLTGAPYSGKTTLLKLLEQKGYQVVPELARVFIDQELAKGITLEELRKDELSFQKKILQHKIDFEKNLDQGKTIFFDRGIPDSAAYYKLCGLENDSFLEQAIRDSSYKKVFLLGFFNFDQKKDYARTETKEEQLLLQKYLEESYKKLNIPLIEVPVVHKIDKNNRPINWKEKRLRYILDNL